MRRLKEFMISRAALQNTRKEVLVAKRYGYRRDIRIYTMEQKALETGTV